MGFSRTAGIPQIDSGDWKALAKLHDTAQQNDKAAKERMRDEFNKRMHARERVIGVGNLLKREQSSKRISPWDPDPYRVTHLNGSLVTATREYPNSQTVVRNSSFFKLYWYEEDWDTDGENSNGREEGRNEEMGQESSTTETLANDRATQDEGQNGREPDGEPVTTKQRRKPGPRPKTGQAPTRTSRRLAHLPPI